MSLYFDIHGVKGSLKEKRVETIPKQEIVYYNEEYYSRELTDKQKEVIEKYKNSKSEELKEIVHRIGDYKVLLITKNGVEMVTEQGTVLDFKTMTIKYSEEEVIWRNKTDDEKRVR